MYGGSTSSENASAQSKHATVIFPGKFVVAGAVEIAQTLSGGVNRLNGDRRLDVCAAVGCRGPIGHVERIGFDNDRSAGPELFDDVVNCRTIELHLVDIDPV